MDFAWNSYLSESEEAALPIPYADVMPYTQGGGRWFKGNTHMHSYSSDGSCFPDEAAALYKRLGWNFLFLTDHNTGHGNPDAWVKSTKGCFRPEGLERLRQTFPQLAPEARTEADGTQSYRLRTLAEIGNLLNEEGRFLVLGGNEVSVNSQNGDDLHCNLLNCNLDCRAQSLADVPANLNFSLRMRDVLIGRVNPEALFVVNHPLWKYYDVYPEYVIAHPSIRFFEVSNAEGGPIFSVWEEAVTYDQWWDVVNTARAEKGRPLLYAVAGDDTHNYDGFYDGSVSAPGVLNYCVVKAPSLTPADLCKAMHQGNFYAARGADFREIAFDRETGTLRVEAEPLPDYDYTVQFIGSRRGTDYRCQRYLERNVEDELPYWLKPRPFNRERRMPVYSPQVGEVFRETRGTTAEYTLQADDLYVRAKLVGRPRSGQGLTIEAWAQPVRR